MGSSSVHYRGRLAPSPTGYLHIGHAKTFWTAYQRSLLANGSLIYRSEDIDQYRCRQEFSEAAMDDLRWLGIKWTEGPDLGGPHTPYEQSMRRGLYIKSFEYLRSKKYIYPCNCSRRDIEQAASAPHETAPVFMSDETLYPGTCRGCSLDSPRVGCNWRFRVPDGKRMQFIDLACGECNAIAGVDFGDFVVWRKDDWPSYQLAVVLDDIAMKITEVVRGQDLLLSTFRQILLYEAMKSTPPNFYHTALVLDGKNERLSKRNQSNSIRGLRVMGATPAQIIA